jgi:hypothetical protein
LPLHTIYVARNGEVSSFLQKLELRAHLIVPNSCKDRWIRDPISAYINELMNNELMGTNRKVGELETRLLQLEAASENQGAESRKLKVREERFENEGGS